MQITSNTSWAALWSDHVGNSASANLPTALILTSGMIIE
jgi:hypothetical protein